jgi:hypothetical protein
MVIIFIETNRNQSTILKKLHKYFIQRYTTKRDVATLLQNTSIVRKLASEVESSEA